MDPVDANSFGWTEAVSAFAGAAFAFGIDLFRERLSVRREQRERCVRAMLALAQMYTELTLIWRQIYADIVREAKEHNCKYPPPHVIRPLAGTQQDSPTLDVPSFAFLAESHAPDLSNRLSVVEARFRNHLQTESIRFSCHMDMQARFEAAGFRPGSVFSVEDAAKAAGPTLWQQLVNLSDFQVDGIPRTLRDIEQARDHFLDVWQFEFPFSRRVGFELASAGEEDGGETFGKFVQQKPAVWRRIARGCVTRFAA